MAGVVRGRPGKAGGVEPGRGESEVARDLIRGLEELVAAAEAGGMAEVEKRFRVTRVRRPAFPRVPADPQAVAAVRAAVGASPAAFAALLGVSANTVRAWEQGASRPSGMAARFLAEVRDDPAYWRKKFEAAGG
ncbi:MAG: helix-turn-helix domain-containing protein [Gemmataceae bacterium]|nr:helix-turn-helix domain-containing protein [Gemmataceae bacterium]